jgi:hypothetical protein
MGAATRLAGSKDIRAAKQCRRMIAGLPPSHASLFGVTAPTGRSLAHQIKLLAKVGAALAKQAVNTDEQALP